MKVCAGGHREKKLKRLNEDHTTFAFNILIARVQRFKFHLERVTTPIWGKSLKDDILKIKLDLIQNKVIVLNMNLEKFILQYVSDYGNYRNL